MGIKCREVFEKYVTCNIYIMELLEGTKLIDGITSICRKFDLAESTISRLICSSNLDVYTFKFLLAQF